MLANAATIARERSSHKPAGRDMLKVFLSYASEDRKLVQPFFMRVKAMGLDPWMDVEMILPGQRWETAIELAFKEAHVIVLFMTPRSVDKRGFVQREANDAMQNLRMRRPEDIYVIPIMLEKCEVPPHISSIVQYIDMSRSDAWGSVQKSLLKAAEQQRIRVEVGEAHGPYRILEKTLEETRDGNPGYNYRISYPHIDSESLPNGSAELSAFFEGRAVATAVKSRAKPWEQDTAPQERFGAGDDDDEGGLSFYRNGRWDSFTVANANPFFFSLYYDVAWYGAGAAHSNLFFETCNLVNLGDAFCEVDLQDFFTDWSEAFDAVGRICQQEIEREYWRRTGEAPDRKAIEWIETGCKSDNSSSFKAFVAQQDGFTFLFAPYEVGPYALSSWRVEVPYYDLLAHLKPNGPHTWAMGKPNLSS